MLEAPEMVSCAVVVSNLGCKFPVSPAGLLELCDSLAGVRMGVGAPSLAISVGFYWVSLGGVFSSDSSEVSLGEGGRSPSC